VKFVDYVSKEELPRLYAEATLFVFPSLYEGFGLPVLEAMSYGCPVVAANGSSIPEVCGEAALYFDPTDVGDIVRTLTKVLTTPDLLTYLSDQGNKRVQEFDWGKTAKQYYRLLSTI
jgi:glycosyltransferase involved in cell wall biosynthesis